LSMNLEDSTPEEGGDVWERWGRSRYSLLRDVKEPVKHSLGDCPSSLNNKTGKNGEWKLILRQDQSRLIASTKRQSKSLLGLQEARYEEEKHKE